MENRRCTDGRPRPGDCGPVSPQLRTGATSTLSDSSVLRNPQPMTSSSCPWRSGRHARVQSVSRRSRLRAVPAACGCPPEMVRGAQHAAEFKTTVGEPLLPRDWALAHGAILTMEATRVSWKRAWASTCRSFPTPSSSHRWPTSVRGNDLSAVRQSGDPQGLEAARLGRSRRAGHGHHLLQGNLPPGPLSATATPPRLERKGPRVRRGTRSCACWHMFSTGELSRTNFADGGAAHQYNSRLRVCAKLGTASQSPSGPAADSAP